MSNKLIVKKYYSAPEAFIFMNENRMLIEQYHYGKLKEQDTMTVLGGDVPLIEHLDNTENDYSLYKTYDDHIKYVWEHFTTDIELNLNQKYSIKNSANNAPPSTGEGRLRWRFRQTV
jgi:hypothetical protein